MSYMVYMVKCTKCKKKVTTAFGIVGRYKVAEPIVDCKCGGKFKKIKETPPLFKNIKPPKFVDGEVTLG